MRELIRALVQMAEGDLIPSTTDRDMLWCPFNLTFEQVLKTMVRFVMSLCLVPFDEDLPLLFRGQHIQFSNTLIGISDDGFQQLSEVAAHACNRRRVEQIAVVRQFAFKSVL